MEPHVQSVGDFAKKIDQDPVRASLAPENQVASLSRMAAPLEKDVWIYRMVVAALGLTVLIGAIGAILLAVAGKPVPEVLVALGSASIGALAGLLAPSPAGK
ncbi:hypothetical protein ANRL1_00617 [Anaerolineae bacterium]|nr:hypothetical protein ANRL1_00617 [Anaerolineae bacterium]